MPYLTSVSWTAFLPHHLFTSKKTISQPVDQQIREIHQQIASTQHRFHALAVICEGGGEITKEVLSSLKNWNLFTDDLLSFCAGSTSALRQNLMLDVPKNFKKFNKLSIQFTQLINCYQTLYTIDRINRKIGSLPEDYTSDLRKELNTLSAESTHSQQKTQKKFIKEVITEIFNDYAPHPVSLLTGLSSQISGKLCKFTVLAYKQWNFHQETKQSGCDLQAFLKVVEALATEKRSSALQRFCALLEAKARQERAVLRLKKFEEVADAIWIMARVVLLFPSFLPQLVSHCLRIVTDTIVFKGSGVFSIVMADSLRKWITPDGLFILGIHGVAMRYLRPHEYSWQGIKYKFYLQSYLIGKKICVLRALANYSWGAIRFLAIRTLYKNCVEDTSHIHSFTAELALSCASLNQRIALVQTKIHQLQMFDLQPDLQKDTDLIAEISKELTEQALDSLSKEIRQLIDPFVEKIEEEPKKSKATTPHKEAEKPEIRRLPEPKTLSKKIQQVLLSDHKNFLKYTASVIKAGT